MSVTSPPVSPSTGLASTRTGRPIKTKNMMATHFLETFTLLLMVEITLAAISRLGRGCIPAGWSSAFADLRIRRTDDLTARRTTKLLQARLRRLGEGFTQPWHSFEISEWAWAYLAPEILGAYALRQSCYLSVDPKLENGCALCIVHCALCSVHCALCMQDTMQ